MVVTFPVQHRIVTPFKPAIQTDLWGQHTQGREYWQAGNSQAHIPLVLHSHLACVVSGRESSPVACADPWEPTNSPSR